MARNVWIAGNYYMDLDQCGQLRIVGPGNHMHFGSTEPRGDLVVKAVQVVRDGVKLSASVPRSHADWRAPAMGHIRRVRRYTDRMGEPAIPFDQVADSLPSELAPTRIERAGRGWRYVRAYGDDWYDCTVTFADDVAVRAEADRLLLSCERGRIGFELVARSSVEQTPPAGRVFEERSWPTGRLGPQQAAVISGLLAQSRDEIEHLVSAGKTSGFDYGTVFPRDWMETADLAQGDLTQKARRYMYHKALEFMSGEGAGWHENVVGEYRHELNRELEVLEAELAGAAGEHNLVVENLKAEIRGMAEWQIARNMIDIEPRYVLALASLDRSEFSEDDARRLRRTARFVMTQAEDHHLITFKRLTRPKFKGAEQFEHAGNWRDSERAFKMVQAPIAPYEVNAVLYPRALEVIGENAGWLQVDGEQVRRLAEKWRRVRELYRFENRDGIQAYALALYNVRESASGLEFQRLEANHLDEAYDFFYGSPSEEQAVSFARRLLDPAYFFTNSGPTVVGAGDGYSRAEYHGRVIWTKQTAFVVAGLERALGLPLAAAWRDSTRELVREALEATTWSALDAFVKLQAFPEVHMDVHGEPRLYTDQPKPEGTMNKVQLWSAAGARRIIWAYLRSRSSTKRGLAAAGQPAGRAGL